MLLSSMQSVRGAWISPYIECRGCSPLYFVALHIFLLDSFTLQVHSGGLGTVLVGTFHNLGGVGANTVYLLQLIHGDGA